MNHIPEKAIHYLQGIGIVDPQGILTRDALIGLIVAIIASGLYFVVEAVKEFKRNYGKQ